MCQHPSVQVQIKRPAQPAKQDKMLHIFISVDGDFFDIGRLNHPGGNHIFHQLANTDASWALRVGHPKDKHVWKLMQHYKIKPNSNLYKEAAQNISPPSKELRSLVHAYETTPYSLREYSWFTLTAQCLAVGVAFMHGIYMLAISSFDENTPASAWWIGIVSCAIAQHWCFHYLFHNACHHTALSTGHKNRALARWSGCIISGYCGRSMIANHAEHHVFTNVEHWDEGLDTGLVTWFVGQTQNQDSKPSLWTQLHKIQHILWWPQLGLAGIAAYLVTFTSWLPFLNGFYYDTSRRPQCSPSKLEAGVFFARNAAFVYYFGFTAFFMSAYIGSFLGTIVASANHFMFEVIDTKAYIDNQDHIIGYINAVTHDSSSSSSCGMLAFHWFFAWINFHLVHHLYPGIALHHVQEYQVKAKQLVEGFGYKYHTLNLIDTYQIMYEKMKRIAAMG